MSSNALAGFLEELDIRTVRHPDQPSRRDLGSLNDLMTSIAKNGLLQPIVVRPLAEDFEVVAGNRRLEACKRLHLSKIACHVIDMDDREAYEMSLVENIQRQTLDPIEEAEALKRYVDEYGYGSTSELALKIAKSEEYVSHRIGLLSLPKDVQDKVSRRQLTPTHAAEIKGLDEKEQRDIVDLIVEENISSREVRQIVKQLKSDLDGKPTFVRNPYFLSMESRTHNIDRTFSKCVAALKVSIMRFDSALNNVDAKEWAVRESLLESRQVLHHEIDKMLRLKRKTRRARPYLERHRA